MPLLIPQQPFRRFVSTLAVLVSLLAAGCGGLEKDLYADWSAERFYREAQRAMRSYDYTGAIKYFETLEARYPYGPYAEQAQLAVGYAYYKDEDAASAIAAADRFIRLHPRNANVDYAYYLKGLASYSEERNVLERWFTDRGPHDRDSKGLLDAYNAFAEVVERFPDSRYAEDSRLRMNHLVNTLAKHEVHVARYYLRRGAYVAAVNRTRYAIEHYPQSVEIKDALRLQADAYDKMGMAELRDDTLRVLKLNFPGG